MTREMKKSKRGKVFINIFPHLARTKKPLEVRMGSGKGNVEEWVAVVKEGKIMFEMTDVTEETAREAFPFSWSQTTYQNKIHKERKWCKQMKTSEIRKMTTEEINSRILLNLKAELWNLRFSSATGSLDKPHKIKQMRHDIARLKTVLNERKEDK